MLQTVDPAAYVDTLYTWSVNRVLKDILSREKFSDIIYFLTVQKMPKMEFLLRFDITLRYLMSSVLYCWKGLEKSFIFCLQFIDRI